MNPLSRITVILISLVFAGAAFDAEARNSNKWRIKFNHTAHSTGEFVLKITPEGGSPIETTIHIKDGQSENSVAKATVKQLKEQLDTKNFHIERDDGEDVLIKRHHGYANFLLELESNNLQHIHIKLKRE